MRINYGNSQSQFCELYLPEKACKGTVCLLHGGFWSMPYGLEQFDDVSQCLSQHGYCVWNIEYRRSGEVGYDWKHAFEDAVTAVNELIEVKKSVSQLDLDNVYVMGHSAGGHLAIWLNSQTLKVPIKKSIGLAPILDLNLAYIENAGNRAVEKLLMGSPTEFPERYDYGSPILQDNKNNSELIIHGVDDDYVPIEWSESYFESAIKQTYVDLIKLSNCGHMDFLDISSVAFQTILELLE